MCDRLVQQPWVLGQHVRVACFLGARRSTPYPQGIYEYMMDAMLLSVIGWRYGCPKGSGCRRGDACVVRVKSELSWCNLSFGVYSWLSRDVHYNSSYDSCTACSVFSFDDRAPIIWIHTTRSAVQLDNVTV